MSNVPTNLIPTKITGLPEYTGSSTLGYLPYVLEGRTYKVQFANIAAVGAVPSTREINTGTGLGGGGNLSANRTLFILPAGVDDSRLTATGVTAGTYGAAGTVPVFNVNAQGRVTSVTDTPIVLANYVPTSRTITAGTGLSGGGDLSANRSFAVNFSSTTPEPLGVGSSGVSTVAARGDHVHPAVDLSDTTETQGVLPLSRGGTGNSLSPVVGAVAYSSNDRLYLTPTSGSAGQVLTSIGGTGAPIWTTLTGTGTVTDVSVVTANGFAGTVANPSTLPAITMQTTVSGMIKGNGTAISAATAGTDYVGPGAITTSGLTMATDRLLGRTAASTGAVEQITVGTGLLLSGGSLTNSAPDQTVSLTGGTAISISGTYPSFTITNTAPDQIVSLTGAGTTVITGTYPSFTITSNDQYVGTVTSVSGTGTVNGITLTGTVTSSGSLTLGGTLSNVNLTSQVTGTLPVANGGTGATVMGTARTNLGAAASGANTDITSIALTTGTISTSPVNGTDIVNKTYADSIASGINFHQSVRLATAAALPANTYNNGASGVGATLTANANGALSVDGVAAVVGNRILVKNEVTQANNGVYTVTQVGDGSTPYILTRATDFDSSGTGVDQIDAGDFFLVTAGSTQSNTSWVQQTPLPITVGTTAIVFTQFAAPVLYSAGTGLTLTATTFSITNTGVSASTYGSASQVPVIAVNAQGQITSASNSSIAIAGSQITSGSVAVAQGGTGTTTLTANGVLLGNGTSAISTTAVGTTGQVLVGNTGAAPTWATLSGIGVTSFSAGTTGLTPSSATTGSITLAGTLNVANGGTGATSLTSGYLLKGNGTSAVSASVVYDDGTNVGIGTASPTVLLDVFSATAANLSVRGNSATNITAHRSSTDATGPNLVLRKSRGTSASQTAVATGDNMGTLVFSAFGGTNNRNIATIASNVEYYVSDSLLSSNLIFSTTSVSTTPTEVMRIDGSGNVGIATASPGAKLDVVGQNAIRATGSQPFLTLRDSGDSNKGSRIQTASGATLFLNDSTGGGTYTERMRIDASGNVGIGTSSPAFKLSVDNGIQNITRYSAQGALLLRAAAGTQASPTQITAGSSLLGNVVGQGYDGSAYQSTAEVRFYSDATVGSSSSPGFMTFLTTASGSTSTTERMRIDSSGNVGIGTTSPATALDVATGFIQLSSGATARSKLFADASVTYLTSEGARAFTISTNSTERMRIDSSGNVGIATSTPQTRFEVYGGLIAGSENRQTHPNANAAGGFKAQWNYTGGSAETDLYNLYNGASESFRFYQTTGSGTAQILYSMLPTAHLFYTGGSERMRINSSGNVGIGTSSQEARLQVRQDLDGTTGVIIQNRNGSGTPVAALRFITGGLDLADDRYASVASGGVTAADLRFITSSGGPAERMRISSGGYVAIGNSSAAPKFSVTLSTGFSWGSAWGGATAVFGGNGSGSGAGSGGLGISYDDTDGASLGAIIPGVAWKAIRLFSDNIQFCTNGATERMRILSTGKVLLGTSSDVDGAPFQIDAAAYGNAVYVTRFTNSSTSTSAYNVSRWTQGASGSSIGYIGTGGSTVGQAFFQNRFIVGTQNNTALCFATNDTFRGMIDGGGQFWWGSQSTIDTVSFAPFQITNALAINTNTTGGTTAVSFFNGQGSGVRVGWIGTSGSATSYNTSSDERLKKNIADAVDAGSVIDAIQVRQFDWKINDEHQRYGMIAQELDEVFPEAVAHGPTETDMLAVDYSKLVPMLVKEVQSLRARVAELEGK